MYRGYRCSLAPFTGCGRWTEWRKSDKTEWIKCIHRLPNIVHHREDEWSERWILHWALRHSVCFVELFASNAELSEEKWSRQWSSTAAKFKLPTATFIIMGTIWSAQNANGVLFAVTLTLQPPLNFSLNILRSHCSCNGLPFILEVLHDLITNSYK